MPLARYFLLVGGALLALLFLADACMPILPLADGANSNRATIRIHSEMKLPERVVYDTSLPTITPVPVADSRRDATGQAVTIVAVPAKAQEAFAELQTSDANRVGPPETRKREAKQQHQRKHARRRVAPYEFRVARQPQFGWFGQLIW
jgi:hypothetical protein